MKSVWTKVGAVALAGVVIANAFIPYAFATDVAAPTTGSQGEAAKAEEYFTTASKVLDFGRITEAGRSYTKAITVSNNTANDVIIDSSVSVYDQVAAENQKLAEWIAFVGGVTHFNIPSGASREVNVRVVVPTDALAGTQYANVELVDANAHKEVVLAKVEIAGDDLKYGSDVSDAYIEPVTLSEALKGRVTVKNTGTAGFTSTYQIRAKNFFGGMDWKVIKQVEQEVFPSKQVEFSCDDQLGFGVFSVEQRVTFANAEGRMVESLLSRTVINIPWWALAIAGGVLFLIILIAIVAKRRKHGKSNQDKLRRAERKARKAEIARVERAEGKLLKKDNDEDVEKMSDKEAQEAIEKFSEEESDTDDEIENITRKLEEEDDGPVDDDAEYDEEEAVPIKVNIRKSSKK